MADDRGPSDRVRDRPCCQGGECSLDGLREYRAPAAVRAALAHVDEHYAEPLALADLAAAAGVSASHLERLFHQYLGMCPSQCVYCFRAERAAEALEENPFVPLRHVGRQVGYGSLSFFYQVFRRCHGVTPGEFRQRVAVGGE